MSAIGLDGFAAKFAASRDPWNTFADRDEAVKRGAILHALGPGPLGRVLELASGNGSNSAAIAPRARRLDATEGTREGTTLTARAVARWPRARATVLALPGRFPRPCYDAIVVAELLYYMKPDAMAVLAADVGAALRPGGRLVLAHHGIDYYDFAQHAAGIHDRFLAHLGRAATTRRVRTTASWIVDVTQVGTPGSPIG